MHLSWKKIPNVKKNCFLLLSSALPVLLVAVVSIRLGRFMVGVRYLDTSQCGWSCKFVDPNVCILVLQLCHFKQSQSQMEWTLWGRNSVSWEKGESTVPSSRFLTLSLLTSREEYIFLPALFLQDQWRALQCCIYSCVFSHTVWWGVASRCQRSTMCMCPWSKL